MSGFRKAVRSQARARVAIDGPAKAGKSMSALRLAFALGGRVAAIDTEFGSLSKYAGDSIGDEGPFDFDVLELKRFAPADYVAAIREAEHGGYGVLIIDSLSHAWVGEGGILDQADRSKTKNNFTKWAELTPQQRKLVDTILASPLHVICTMRSKTEWVLEADAGGKQRPRRVGTAPVQREGMEYEFDMLLSADAEHLVSVTGSRCPAMDRASCPEPGAAFFKPYVDWLKQGTAEHRPDPLPELTAAPAPAPSTNGTATNGTAPLPPKLAELKRLKEALNLDAEQWATILHRRGPDITSARDLTETQQDELIGRLTAKLQAVGQTLQEAMADAGPKSNDASEIPD